MDELLNGYNPKSSNFLFVKLPNDDSALSICKRSVLIKTIHQIWAIGDTVENLIYHLRNLPRAFFDPYFVKENSWSVQVDAFCKTFTMEQKHHYRELFRFLEFEGPVDINHAAIELWLMLDFSRRGDISGVEVTRSRCYFGRLVACGGMREELKKYDLKKRLYLGPTSLDGSLAILLANLSLVRQGTFAFDPFVGTASILVALTHFGAVCTGFGASQSWLAP